MAGTVTYKDPIIPIGGSGATPGTVPPSAVQMLGLSRVTALVAFVDADTTALITHNMNIPLVSTPSQHGQQQASPIVIIGIDSSSAGTLVAPISFTRGTNTLTLTKLATSAGTNVTLEVNIERYEPIE
jgi:hypothetical protein